jgi:hypothetical protein
MTRIARAFIAMALPIMAFALTPNAATAQSYTGNWPITISHSHFANGTYCLMLTESGPYSGTASVNGFGEVIGTFQIINGLLVVTIDVDGSGAEPASVLFIGNASGGNLSKKGFYEQAQGEVSDSGALQFGTKNGC